MDHIVLKNSHSCCNALIKFCCWLILAKYGASKLDMIKEITQNATLSEFESRVYLHNRFNSKEDKFLVFIEKVYKKTITLISNYIHCPDWSIFCNDDGQNSLQQLEIIIAHEISMASTVFTLNSHKHCFLLYHSIKQQILSIADSWSNTNFIYLNYISATISDIFTDNVKKILSIYEKHPNNYDLKWLCTDIMLHFDDRENDYNQLWFLSDILNDDYSENLFHLNNNNYDSKSDDELWEILSQWLYRETKKKLKINTKWLMNYNPEDEPARIFNREQLSTFLNVPTANLELHLTMSSANELSMNFNVSNTPHYFVPDYVINDLQNIDVHAIQQPNVSDLILNENLIKNDYCLPKSNEKYCIKNENTDTIDFIINSSEDKDNLIYNDKIMNIKNELEQLNQNNSIKIHSESAFLLFSSQENEKGKKIVIPKLKIRSKNEFSTRRSERISRNMFPAVRRKKRGRPRKIEYYNFSSSKNGQHKYSTIDVQDCSSWIRDNFYEIADIKPAIDRARMYEIYTNYCALKCCTPVDRALFGKIIRKVFPKLKSRRLIQNQVLKYHYVGLKPKFVELEEILFNSDTTKMSPEEIFLSYVPLKD